MSLRDWVRSLRTTNEQNLVTWQVDPHEGVDFVFDRSVLAKLEEVAIENILFGIQLTYLKGLHEQGMAAKNRDGYTVPSDVITTLEEDLFEVFQLPAIFHGKFKACIQGNTSQAAFKLNMELTMPDGATVHHYALDGPFLTLAENERYRLSPSEYQAMKAVDDHQLLPATERSEYQNNWLIFQLQMAKAAGMNLDLSHFNRLELVHPESIGVAVEELSNGDLSLTPTYGGGFELSEIQRRLGQIENGADSCILRVKDRFVLLDAERLEATKEILSNPRIPKGQVAKFLSTPTAYLNASMINLDTGFSLRVHGAERFTHRYFGDVEESGIDWFNSVKVDVSQPEALISLVRSNEDLQEIKDQVEHARANVADTIEVGGAVVDISDPVRTEAALEAVKEKLERHDIEVEDVSKEKLAEDTKLEPAVVAIDANDEAEEYISRGSNYGLDATSQTFSEATLGRSPFPHQVDGIKWLLAHMDLASKKDGGSGALLADDMGLGKTFMTLVAMNEWYRRKRESNQLLKPILIVAPLSLLENWVCEVEQTFKRSPFSDIVLLQAAADLKEYKVAGTSRETKQEFSEDGTIVDQDEIRYSLKVGKNFGPDRLDMPARLVLTTYQTLRDYQFSLSLIDWAVVAFDEAQNLKNPNALATRAAKGLRSDFKLLATGTPVENSLKDIWCLMDTAVPGLLGAWQAFRSKYIAPILSAEGDQVQQVKLEIGRSLRAALGDYMLRRTKEEKIDGLPQKRVYTGDASAVGAEYLDTLYALMKGLQLERYDEIIAEVRTCASEDKRGMVLVSLMKLKLASIHPEMVGSASFPVHSRELLSHAEASSKIRSLIAVLKDIHGRGEKVLIFATSKAVQSYVSALVRTLFKVSVDVINGDTKAVSSVKGGETRKGIIDAFQSKDGFAVIVMSPIAAGVGLTIVEANNVVHLERHWNPAKEAQATDRVYRIGQKRDVNVYLPMAVHPELRSFDLHLNTLLSQKIGLSDAVVASDVVEPDDLVGCML